MTDKTTPRARLDDALEEMRSTLGSSSQPVRLTAEATVACAEALSLLVDAHLAAVKPKPKPQPEPEPDARESLPDDTPVGHGWVVGGRDLFKPDGNGRLTWWLEDEANWGVSRWEKRILPAIRPATVGDLRRVGVPLTEWPDITAPEPEPESSRAEKAEAELRARELHHFEAEQSEANAIAERDNAIAALRAIWWRMAQGVNLIDPNGDIRKTYREALTFVEAEARRRGIDLDGEVS